MWHVHLDAWARTYVKCLTKKKAWGGQREKLYTATYGRLLLLELEQLTGNNLTFVEYWATLELISRRDGKFLQMMQAPSY